MRWAVLVVLAGCDKLLSLEPVSPPAGHGPWTAIAVGGAHACGIQGDGSLWCWGDNSTSQLGLSAVLEVDAPARVGTAGWRSLAAGDRFTCGIQRDGSLWCWGDNSFGQTGTGQRGVRTQNDRLDNSTYVTPEPTRIDGTWKQVSAGTYFACALRDDDTLWCWGDDGEGQLADPETDIARPSPIQVAGTWTSVSAGAYHACAIQSDGTLWCWGQNNSGQLGLGSFVGPVPMPGQVGLDVGITQWRAVDAGGDGTCAIADSDDATLYCWGTPSQAFSPAAVTITKAPFQGATAVAVGGSASATTICALGADRSLFCWGDDSRGQAGPVDADKAVIAEPVPVRGGAEPWTTVEIGGRMTCAIGSDESLWCSGANGRGQLGAGTSHRVPSEVAGTWAHVSAGTTSTCALDTAGGVSCTGSSYYGGIGDGLTIDRRSFTPTAAAPPMIAISAGVEAACAIAAGGDVWCWGLDSYCQLGDSCTLSGLRTPTHSLTAFQALAFAINDHTCAVDTGHRLWCWGNNMYGQTADATIGRTNDPTMVADGRTWTQVAVGPYHSCGITTAGTFCWGAGSYGQLGNGSVMSDKVSTPSLVLGTATYTSVVVGYGHSCAIATDQTAWCWGLDDVGQLGINGFGEAVLPKQLDGTWQQLAAGYYHTCGVRTDGTLWCWGENAYGQLGDDTLASRDSPTQVGSDTSWVEVTAGPAHTCAIRSDGSLWCWGLDDSGQLGDGTAWTDQLQVVP